MTTLVTLDKRQLDDLVFRSCEQATANLTDVPLRLRATFAIEAATRIMQEVDAMSVAVPAVLATSAKGKPAPPRGRPRKASNVPPAPGHRPTPTPAADITPSVMNTPVPDDAVKAAATASGFAVQ